MAWLLVAQPILIGASLRTHFDALAVALMLAGAGARRRRKRPVAGLDGARPGDDDEALPGRPRARRAALAARRGAATGRRCSALGAFLAVVLVIALPFAGSGLVDMARFHLDRPVQIESSPATRAVGARRLLRHGHEPHPGPLQVQRARGRRRRARSRRCSRVLMIAGLLAAIPLARRDLVLSATASVLAFVALGKVLSPQYVIWLAPFAALALGPRRRAGGRAHRARRGAHAGRVPAPLPRPRERRDVGRPVIALRNAALVAALVAHPRRRHEELLDRVRAPRLRRPSPARP